MADADGAVASFSEMAGCTRSVGCTCPLCDMSMAEMGAGAAAASDGECTRSMGCTCPLCDMSAAALGDVTNQTVGSSSTSPCARTEPAYTFAALNYNASRTPGDAYDVEKDGKLGSVYTMLTEVLAARGDWKRAKAERKTIEAETQGGRKTDELKLPRSFQLLLGTAQGKGIKFGQLGYGMWPPPLVNYYRGFNCICRKALLIQTLREAAGSAQHEHELLAMMPDTFLFYPARADDADLNEHEHLANAFEARAEQLAADTAGTALNLWILKPSDGAKGERIELMSDLSQIQAFLKAQTESEGTSGWVVQRYIDRPLLLRGDRKFDVRCWVLLDPDYNIFLYREGVLRTGAVAYSVSAENLDDKFIHLTNHCIAAKHPDFGKFEATNEMFYPEFSDYLQQRFAGTGGRPPGENILDSVILPQFKRIVVDSLEAARGKMESGSDYYKSFHLFGYDFLVDADLKAWLCEINASPAVAEELMPKLVRDLIGMFSLRVYCYIHLLHYACLMLSLSCWNTYGTNFGLLRMLPTLGVVIDENEHLPPFGDEAHRAGLAEAQKAWAEDLAKYSTGLVRADENGFEKISATVEQIVGEAAPEPSEEY